MNLNSPNSPDLIGRYHRQHLLGRGGFATVYKAFDPRFSQDVAVKILDSRFVHDVTERKQFINEARLLRSFDNENLVDVFDVGETEDGLPYLVMTYANGGSLADRLVDGHDNATPQSDAQIRQLIKALAGAIGYLHDQQMVHRDIKPANILYRSVDGDSEDGERILVADFGMVKNLRDGGVTRGGGSLAYAAPEQRATVAVVDERTDIYAASATVAEAALGRVRRADESWDDMLGDLSQSRPQLAEALRLGLQPTPADRCQTVRQWANASDAAVSSRFLAPSRPAPAPRRSSRRYLLAATGLLALAGLAGFQAIRSTGIDPVESSGSCIDQPGSVPAPEVVQTTTNAIVVSWQPNDEVLNLFVNGSYLDSTAPDGDLFVIEREPKRVDRLAPDTEYEIGLARPEQARTITCARTLSEPVTGEPLLGVYAPTGLEVTSASATAIEVTWDLRTGADFHNLFLNGQYVKTSDGGGSTTVGDTVAYTFTDLEPATTYDIGIRRVEGTNRSEQVTIQASTSSN